MDFAVRYLQLSKTRNRSGVPNARKQSFHGSEIQASIEGLEGWSDAQNIVSWATRRWEEVTGLLGQALGCALGLLWRIRKILRVRNMPVFWPMGQSHRARPEVPGGD